MTQPNFNSGPHSHYHISTGEPCRCGWGRPDLLSFSKVATSWDEMKGWKKLQNPEAQATMQELETRNYVRDNTEKWMPWLLGQMRQGNLNWGIPTTYGNLKQLMYYPIGTGSQVLSRDRWNHWADWFNSGHPTRQAIDPNKATVHDVHPAIEAWDKDMEARQRSMGQQDGTVVHSYPNGWTLRELSEPDHLKREGDAMGHCVGGYGDRLVDQGGNLQIFSLRDPQGEPHVTHGVQHEHDAHGGGDPGYAYNVNGKGNREPLPEYADMLKQYWSTVPPEQRPRSENDNDDYFYNDLDHIQEVAKRIEAEKENPTPKGEPDTDEYGFIKSDGQKWEEPEWKDLLGEAVPTRNGEYATPHWDALDDVYNVAHHYGHIPNLAKGLEDYQQDWQDEFDRHYEPGMANYNPDTGEEMPYHSEFDWDPKDEELIEDLKNHDFPPTEEGLEQYSEKLMEAETGERDYWAEQDPRYQMINHMYKKINPHFVDGPEPWSNEIPNPEKVGRTASSGPLYYRWVFTPSGVELSHNDDDHPAHLQYHQDLGSQVNEQSMVHGYAYRIKNGWRLTDWEHQPVEDPYIHKSVVDAINNEEGMRVASVEEPTWEPAELDFDRLHYGRPLPRIT